MGSQQMFLIIASIVVVGIAVALGIVIINNQSYNNNRQTMITEMQQIASHSLSYWKSSVAMGGAGEDVNNLTLEGLAKYLGFTESGGAWVQSTDTGEYRLGDFTNDTFVLRGLGKETKGNLHPYVQMEITLSTNQIRTTNSDSSSY